LIDLRALGPRRDIEELMRFDRVMLFGAGNSSDEAVRFLRDKGKTIVAYFDNNPALAGTVRNGIEVLPVSDIHRPELADTAIIVSTEAQSAVGRQLLEDLDIPLARVFPCVSHMVWNHYRGDALLAHADAIDRVFQKLGDDESRAYLTSVLTVRWTLNPSLSRRNPLVKGHYLYDRPEAQPREGDVIIDCGAYTGDTTQIYLERLHGNCKVYALEPYGPNFEQLTALAARETNRGRIVPLQAAAGATKGVGVLSSMGIGPSMYPRLTSDAPDLDPSLRVPIVVLDDLFENTYRDKVRCIKMDVEGGEAEALRGATSLIRRDRPTLVISGYHRPEDFWAIPALVEEIDPSFRLFAGHNHGTVHEVEYYFVY